MPSLSNRLNKVAKTIGRGVSHENINVIFGTTKEDAVFIMIIHNTALQGIVKPSIHDTDITDFEFMQLAAKEQRVSLDTISKALSNENNFVVPHE